MRQSVSFGGYRFEPPTGRLWSGTREIRLTPKAAAVLGVLVAHAGDPVSKEVLFASVWRDTIVGDDALTSCIQELRKALDDDPKQPHFIETRHRRGYRFVASLIPAADENAATDSRSNVSGSSGKPTLAVLPFENIGGDPEQEYFSDGITEDIITALSKHRSLLVIARGSTFAFRWHGADVCRVGRELGADYVVEGSVGRMGRFLRIRTRLVETGGGRCVWADQYDRDVNGIFEVQDEIIASIAARIEPEVGGAERIRVQRMSEHALRAWDFFHLGMRSFYKFTSEDNVEAQRLFRRAIDVDPALAQAYAWLSYAMVLGMVYFDADPEEARLNEAVAIARKGLELDDQDALTHFTCGRVLLARKSYQDALAELESAVELNPNLAVVYCGLGDSLAYEGRFTEAIPYFEKAINLSPHDPQRWAFCSYRALAHLLAGEYAHAVEWAQKATRIPNCHYWPFAHRVSALGHLQRAGDLPSAVAELLQRKPEFSCTFAGERLFYIKDPAHLERYVEGLRRAGLRE
ncbi:MAG: winged helix-turn-helix domain-containing tetratricopeptide repeat protein [Gammaproteobacteria bacterium]